jgi:hypothetical protein
MGSELLRIQGLLHWARCGLICGEHRPVSGGLHGDMDTKSRGRTAIAVLAAGAGLAAGAYAAYAGTAWCRYGRVPPAAPDEADALLDQFMPAYDVVERHHIRVAAPAALTLAAAADQDLFDAPLVRAIFKARELVLGATPNSRPQPRGLLAQVRSLGWEVLADVTGREIVVGAATQPWKPNVTFRTIPPAEFAAFREPGYVKIAWTLRADPLTDTESVFRTETRAVATDAFARTRFRRYWAFASPGIRMIRWLSMRPLKRAAEQRARVISL